MMVKCYKDGQYVKLEFYAVLKMTFRHCEKSIYCDKEKA